MHKCYSVMIPIGGHLKALCGDLDSRAGPNSVAPLHWRDMYVVNDSYIYMLYHLLIVHIGNYIPHTKEITFH